MKNEIRAVQMGLAAQLPIHLIGIPGVGKTATVQALARQMDRHLEVMIAANRDRTDFGGIPVVREGRLVLEQLPWVDRLLKAPRGAILFLDEIGGAPPDVRPSLLRVIAERWVGDVFLPPEKVAILAASNPGELGEGEGPETWSLALRTRFVHIRWPTPDVDEFTRALVTGWKIPELRGVPSQEAIQAALPEAKDLVAGFLRLRPERLAPLPKPGEPSLGWPNPRTWERFAAPALATWIAGGRNPEDLGALHLLLTGALGAVGAEFLTWIREQDLPDPEEILADPKGFPLPKRQDHLHVYVTMVVGAVVRKPSPQRWEAAWEYLRRFPEDILLLGGRMLVEAYREGGWANQPEWKGFVPFKDQGLVEQLLSGVSLVRAAEYGTAAASSPL